jgi:hypothetical protein
MHRLVTTLLLFISVALPLFYSPALLFAQSKLPDYSPCLTNSDCQSDYCAKDADNTLACLPDQSAPKPAPKAPTPTIF